MPHTQLNHCVHRASHLKMPEPLEGKGFWGAWQGIGATEPTCGPQRARRGTVLGEQVEEVELAC